MGAPNRPNISITQSHLDLISRIYDTPLNPDAWPVVLEEFASVMNAGMAGIAVYDPILSDHQFSAVTPNFSASLLEEYTKQFSERYESAFSGMSANPKRTFLTDREMRVFENGEQYAERPIVQWLNENLNISRGAASCLNVDRAWTDILFVMYPGSRGSVTPQERRIGNSFLDHFAKSVELGRAFGVLKHRFNGTFTALDRFHIGIYVLSPNGSVVLTNAEADRQIDAGDGLTLSRARKIFPTDDGQRSVLKDAIALAAGTALGQKDCAETLLTLPRQSGADPYLVEVSPIREKEEIGSQFSGCLVFVIDPAKTDVVSTAGMQTLYSLTNAEAEVCKLVAKGFGTDEIADVRNLTRETVRNYIKLVLNKTGVKNRSQLVRLALHVNLPIDPASDEG